MTSCRDVLRLQRWDLHMSTEPAGGDDSIITIAPNPARHIGVVRIGSFFDEPRREQRHAVVHELCHLVQAELHEWVVTGTAEQALRPAGLDWVLERVKEELEVQADAFARAIAPRLPMPPRWPK